MTHTDVIGTRCPTALGSACPTPSRSPFAAAPPAGALANGAARVKFIDPDRFDEIAADFADVTQEQTAGFVRARWGGSRLETMTIERNGRVIGAAAVVVIRIPANIGGVAIVKWGPLLRKSDASEDPNLLVANLAALKHEYVERRQCYLTVMPQADPGQSKAMVTALEKLGFTQGAAMPSPERYLVNVSLSSEDLRKSLDQKWRYNLKKAERNAFDISIVDVEEGIARFMRLYEQMMTRKRFKDSSAIRTLPDLMRTPVAALKPMIVMLRHEGSDVAGAVIDTSGERAVYLYGATDDRALPLKAGFALHWWIADLLCSMPRVRWYDLGGNDGDRGLHQFKKGFVGNHGAIELMPPSYNCCNTALSALIGHSVYGLRRAKAAVGDLTHRIKARKLS